MVIGKAFNYEVAAGALSKILNIATEKGIGYWFIPDDEVYRRNIPYDLKKQYEGDEINNIFRFDPDEMLVITVALYGRITPISMQEYIKRIMSVTPENIEDGELFIYVCDDECFDIYTKDNSLISEIINACSDRITDIKTITATNCTRKNWQIS